MLDQQTKKKIDSARQILVGKVPDPKAQVDQITTALIYKFMDDMDEESKTLGGKALYFSGKFKNYSWRAILDKKLSGEERFNLYIRAINELPKNAKLPSLFREVFKNAFLPYRDPETLNLFLKEINGFSYDDSENLGNAFEYLLSILGSQGDAGQFRTPRHIIDFIVEVLSPTKDDTILDPACGTGGFLISAYKHIERDHSEDYDSDRQEMSFRKGGLDAFSVPIQHAAHYKGEKLTPRERKKLKNNIVGYDISPDMTKLALVNMYLHKFKEPQIYEYDTLTNDNRWGDTFDLILANPPFMSPKGGIRPHNRFSMQSSRSEVLFVDYMAEHLSINGRAGIIVPEGIIFKTDKAYKHLRKILVEENFLWAVVSLPAGIFQPYSGVKTSILFLDRKRAKTTDKILFLDIQSDGFELGATRRRTEKNDLPEACRILKYDRINGKKQKKIQSELAHWVKKKKIIDSGDWNLSGNRYKKVKARPTQWPMVELGEVARYINGFAFKPQDWKQSGKKIIRIQNLTGTSEKINYTNRTDIPEKYLVHRGDLLISWSATIGFYIWNDSGAYLNQHIFKVDVSNKILKKYLYYLKNKIVENIHENVHGNTMQHITKSRFEKIRIPLPPLDIQKEIVAEIEGYQKIIDGAKQVIDNWKPTVKVDPKWEMVELGEVCTFVRGPFGGSLRKEIFKPSGYLVYEQYHAINNDFEFARYFIDEKKFTEMKRFEVFSGDLLISRCRKIE